MMDVAVAAVAVLLAAIGSEFLLHGTKLQTGLARLVVAWIAAFFAAAGWFVLHDSSLIALTIFSAGAFLVWFGVRSHIESSIVLRMLFLLREGPMSDGELIAAYTSRYGEATRMEELRRGGLIANSPGGMRVTPKGKMVLRFVSTLR